MKRKALVKAHVIATIIAGLTIATFFLSSLITKLNGSETLIREIKEVIVFSLPLLLISIPVLGVTGVAIFIWTMS